MAAITVSPSAMANHAIHRIREARAAKEKNRIKPNATLLTSASGSERIAYQRDAKTLLLYLINTIMSIIGRDNGLQIVDAVSDRLIK